MLYRVVIGKLSCKPALSRLDNVGVGEIRVAGLGALGSTSPSLLGVLSGPALVPEAVGGSIASPVESFDGLRSL
jgi:hypothetical protein